ncbi:MAG: hypothetical protein KDD11_04845 [Acidobacteria bacterium]|nr:hypothetical protein [Acidobacteriota bacterium]
MVASALIQFIRGSTHFLRPEVAELHRLLPSAAWILPLPQRIFLEDESATPLRGFPVLRSRDYERLRAALLAYFEQEERSQVAAIQRTAIDPKRHASTWETYRRLLSQALENVTLSSHGRQFPAIFWLLHSHDIARCLKETPKRLRRLDLEVGRQHGDQVKYRVFDRYQDRLLSTTYDLVHRLAEDTEEVEEELFPRLLRRMLDNVLIFTEDHVSYTLEELASYFAGYLNIDGRDFLSRLAALDEWHREKLARDQELANAVRHLVAPADGEDPGELLRRSGYVSFLAGSFDYPQEELLPPASVQVWESLLLKLKEFELFHALRRYATPIRRDEAGRMTCRPTGLSRPASGLREVVLSSATRPMDFMAPWVVDPLVHRFGLVYDITDFSSLVSVMRLSGPEVQDQSFRRMFRFQRRVHRLAAGHRMKLEKYLGDGAFFSGRHPRDLLVCALQLQRIYQQAVLEGFPFDRGLRIALNFGSYRLVPLHASDAATEAERYEFFGHGLVELSRLTTGKASREIDEIKTMLISQGYPEATVHRFFAPMMDKNVDAVDKVQEGRRFFAYINRNGSLVNEGIVATAAFINELDSPAEPLAVARCSIGGRPYLLTELEDAAGRRLPVALRKLGIARLKGLDDLAVYEVVDGDEVEPGSLEALPPGRLLVNLDREFADHRLSRA